MLSLEETSGTPEDTFLFVRGLDLLALGLGSGGGVRVRVRVMS
jgi:hypothetical protein